MGWIELKGVDIRTGWHEKLDLYLVAAHIADQVCQDGGGGHHLQRVFRSGWSWGSSGSWRGSWGSSAAGYCHHGQQRGKDSGARVSPEPETGAWAGTSWYQYLHYLIHSINIPQKKETRVEIRYSSHQKNR